MISDIGDISPPETSSESNSGSTTEQNGPPALIVLPFVIPLAVGAAAINWIYEVYQRVPVVQRKFMAYIVDLTHILEILFALPVNNGGKELTRSSIEIAYNAYLGSLLQRTVHSDVNHFHGVGAIIGGQDLILEKIESLLRTSYTSDVALAQSLS